MVIHDVFESYDNATNIFDNVYGPNIHKVILVCTKIIHSISQTSASNPCATVKNVLDSIKVKFSTYFNEFPNIYGIAACLHPGIKIDGITYDVSYYLNKCKSILDRLCEHYGTVIQPKYIGSSFRGKSRFGSLLGPNL
ncbi:Alpha-glucan water dikinase 2, partial [Bienertia sinuspersici]